jgi:hypothetical protein
VTAETLESLRSSFNRRIRAEGKADRTFGGLRAEHHLLQPVAGHRKRSNVADVRCA